MEDWVRYIIETKQEVGELKGQVAAIDKKVDELKDAITRRLDDNDRRYETLSGRLWALFLMVGGVVAKWVWDRVAG